MIAIDTYREYQELIKIVNKCQNCNRLLFKGVGNVEIKCPKCGTINVISSKK